MSTSSEQGYSHIFSQTLDPKDSFRGFGLEHSNRNAILLKNLSQLLNFVSSKASRFEENPRIPAGYTYLAQFSMHDMSFNSAPSPLDACPFGEEINFRQRALRLDTLYGRGPTLQPYLYECGVGPYFTRNRLVRGYWSNSKYKTAPFHTVGDIPRTANAGAATHANISLTEAILADPRNDDNAIVAQISVIFSHFHNVIVEICEEKCLSDAIGQTSTGEIFHVSRMITESIFRTIITDDLLKRLINPSVYEYYFLDANKPKCSLRDQRMPKEFSHAVMRAGHAMVRDHYIFNDENIFGLANVLTTSSRMNSAAMPLSEAWMIDWSYFFPLDGNRHLNFSRKFSPHISAPMTRDINLEPNAKQNCGLLGKDFYRAQAGSIRSVDSCIEYVAPHLRKKSRLLADRSYRIESLKNYLSRKNSISIDEFRLSSEEIDVIAQDPPLLFFTLFESMIDMQGECFGILGSTIASDVFSSYLFDASHAERVTTSLSRYVIENAFAAGLPSTMPDLLKFIQSHDTPSHR